MDTLSAYGTVSTRLNSLLLIGSLTIYGITSTKTTTNRIYMSNNNTANKEVLRCACGHAYFEGEGCKGCYYTLKPYKLDKYCVDDGIINNLLGRNLNKDCKGCGNKFETKKTRSRFCDNCTKDRVWFELTWGKKSKLST